ncbi:B-cell antigen receptor complex-associated protein alpha chain [Betta splendens]|uniref:B-cell antigen receptor complex-associated protein alpha chain n=1 Tax=Betta splendens TaxID=158456 RepID=A0A6P7KP68_BETSP|nr:B-cell antigen receptor complex-associated protein alpha chain [Betta splendens]
MATFAEVMMISTIFVLCVSAVGSSHSEVLLAEDELFVGAQVSEKVELTCCFTSNGKALTPTWIKHFYNKSNYVDYTILEKTETEPSTSSGFTCGKLTLKSVKVNDSGFYQCELKDIEPKLYTHGTYLQVYRPLDKTINISEMSKNKILVAEGILLLLCAVLPTATLLLKSRGVKALEKKKAMKEEENIYQGLNLDDCCSTYDQIERSQAQGPYQDVCNITEEEKDIQLEKP